MDNRLTRRRALGAALAGVAASSLPNTPGSAAARAQRFPLYRGGRFDSGIAAGDPGTRSVSLWTRLHGASHPGRLSWEVARDPGFANTVAHGTVRTKAERDYTARVDLSRGLKPGERYWYRFHTRKADSAVGSFRTLRPPDSNEPVRIAVYSCQDYESGFYAAHRGIAAEPDLDLVVMVGDYIYERAAAGGVREDKTGSNHDGDAQSLAEYREKHRLYRSDPDLQAMHAAHPQIAFWDSHDVEPIGSDAEEKDQYGSKRRVPHRPSGA